MGMRVALGKSGGLVIQVRDAGGNRSRRKCSERMLRDCSKRLREKGRVEWCVWRSRSRRCYVRTQVERVHGWRFEWG